MIPDVKALKAKCAANLAEMEATFERMSKVGEDKDLSEDEVATKNASLEAIYEDLKVKATSIKVEIVRSEELAEIRKDAAKLQELAAPSPTNVEGEGEEQKLAATAKNVVKEEREVVKLFCDWMAEKSVPDSFMQRMQPTSPKLQEKASPGMAMVMPRSMARNVVGSYWGAKADGILLSGGGHGESNIFDDEFKPTLLELPPEPGIVYPRTTKVPTTTGTVKWPRLVQTDGDEHGSVAVSWQSEGGEAAKTEPQFDQLPISTNELAAQTQVSRTLLGRSAFDLEAFIPRLFRSAIVHELDNVVLDGSGSGRPLGILQDSDVRTVFRKTVDKLVYEDFVKMKYKIRAHHRPSALWVIADDAIEEIISLKDSDGRPFFVTNPLAGQMDRLLGIPMVTTHRTSFKSDGDAILGDWSQYISPVEQEVLVQRSEHRHMEKGLILFVVTVLVGGRAALPRAFVYLKATVS